MFCKAWAIKLFPLSTGESLWQSGYLVMTEPVVCLVATLPFMLVTQHWVVMCSAGKLHFPTSPADESERKWGICHCVALSTKSFISPFHGFLVWNSCKRADTQQSCQLWMKISCSGLWSRKAQGGFHALGLIGYFYTSFERGKWYSMWTISVCDYENCVQTPIWVS